MSWGVKTFYRIGPRHDVIFYGGLFPGDSLFKLPPHVDGGGLERWSDQNYRKVYRNIFENFEKYDPFEVDYRTQANMNELGIANGCTFFRYL